MEVVYRRATLGEIINLRAQILRPGRPLIDAAFAGDEAEQTRHYGAFAGEQVVACLTFLPSTWDQKPAWQLRGMAVREDYRRGGVGRRLLRCAQHQLAHESTVRMMWCNAREPAVEFYKNQNWQVVGDRFDVPGVGPHVKMFKQIQEGGAGDE